MCKTVNTTFVMTRGGFRRFDRGSNKKFIMGN